MKIIAVDDEEIILERICDLTRKVEPQAEVRAFSDCAAALAFVAENPIDVALLDIKMPGMSGLALAKRMKELCKNVNIIFVTGYGEHSMNAMKLRASGYLMKPVREKDLKAELSNLRNPILPEDKHMLKIQTFGHFEVFYDNAPIVFARKKAKELLAYLVDRNGASITLSELASVLWEDGVYGISRQKQIHVFIASLKQTLKEFGADQLVVHQSRSVAFKTDQLDCDYHRFLSGDVNAINSYHGEYMLQYSWAEFTCILLDTYDPSPSPPPPEVK